MGSAKLKSDDGVMSHCTTHSFEVICRGWKVGLGDFFQTMHHFLVYEFSYSEERIV